MKNKNFESHTHKPPEYDLNNFQIFLKDSNLLSKFY
jgi:hypothetical protein